jgi:hypothetical protein
MGDCLGRLLSDSVADDVHVNRTRRSFADIQADLKDKNDVFHAFRGMESCLFFFSDGEETPYKRKVAC